MPVNLENPAEAIGLQEVSFHSNPKERQCQRMFKPLHSCTHFTCMLKILQARLQQYMNWELPDVQAGFIKAEEPEIKSVGSQKKQKKKKSSIYFIYLKVNQLCLTLCDPMDCTVHGILQARILEWVAVPFSRGSSQPRDRIQVSYTAGGLFTSWATRGAQGCWNYNNCTHPWWLRG